MKDIVEVTQKHHTMALDLLLAKLDNRITKHGTLSHASPHESLGIITEEYYELIDAVHKNNTDKFISESIDVALSALYSAASALAKQDSK